MNLHPTGTAMRSPITFADFEAELDLADAFEAVSPMYSAETAAEAAGVVAGAIEAVIGADGIGIYLYDFDEHLMRRVAARPDGWSEPTIAMGLGLLGTALRDATERALTFAGETLEAAAWDELALTDLDHGALLIRAVWTRGRLRGGIVLARAKGGDPFTPAEATVVDYIAERFATVL